jgi:serine/threonine-protein kinase
MSLEIGTLIHHDRYHITGLLGQGGMGAVYVAQDTSLNKTVAIKENLETSPEAQKQFNREANILAHLSHPNLPRVTDYFYIPGQGQYLVMDYVDGEDLQAMMTRLGRLPEPQVLAWIGQISDALAYLHSQNPPIIHRDIKPSNIKIHPDGRAMLVDFGIAKFHNPQIATTVGAKMVTPGYSPPEQYGGGGTDTRSDIYALGATLFNLLTGQAPPESVMRVVNTAVLPPPRQMNPQISPEVEQVILKSVELSTERRYQSVDELNAALRGTTQRPARTAPPGDEYSAREVLPFEPYPPPAPGSPQPARRRAIPVWVWAGGAALALCLLLAALGAAAAGVMLFRRPEPTATAAALAVATTAAPLPTATATPVPATPTPLPSPTLAASPTADNRPANAYDPVASLLVPGGQPIRAVAEKDGYLYVLTRQGELSTFDLTGLADQQDFTVYDKPIASLKLQNGLGLLRNGDALYAYGNIGYQIVDIGEPSSPELVSGEPGPPIYNMLLYQKNLIVSGEGRFIIYDASDATRLRPLSTTNTGSGSSNFAAAVKGDRLYTSLYTVQGDNVHSLLMVYNISDPDGIILDTQRVDARDLAYHLRIFGDKLVRCTVNDLEVWDLSEKDKPRYESAERGQGRVCALDQDNLIINGAAFVFADRTLRPLDTFDAQAEAGDLPPGQLAQSESYPYTSVVAGKFVFLPQDGRVLVLAGFAR